MKNISNENYLNSYIEENSITQFRHKNNRDKIYLLFIALFAYTSCLKHFSLQKFCISRKFYLAHIVVLFSCEKNDNKIQQIIYASLSLKLSIDDTWGV